MSSRPRLKKPQAEAKPADRFEAAQASNVEAVRQLLAAGADVSAVGEHGFTALQRAAMGSNQADDADNLAVLKMLVEAGSPLEFAKEGDGRTALYFQAEFSNTVESVQYLLDAGANPDVSDSYGNHVTVNAMLEEVQALLSRVTGVPLRPSPPPEPDPVKLNAAGWREAKARLEPVFAALEAGGLVVLQDAGVTQSDGFSDCAEVFEEKGGTSAGLHGFCFYSRQDLNRVKRTSALSLSFWGAPEGAEPDMRRVGQQVVDAFEQAGYTVHWNGSGGSRPTVYLHPV
jgi:Ankyrin repeats (3 copies)